jgi:hypothetical protein
MLASLSVSLSHSVQGSWRTLGVGLECTQLLQRSQLAPQQGDIGGVPRLHRPDPRARPSRQPAIRPHQRTLQEGPRSPHPPSLAATDGLTPRPVSLISRLLSWATQPTHACMHACMHVCVYVHVYLYECMCMRLTDGHVRGKMGSARASTTVAGASRLRAADAGAATVVRHATSPASQRTAHVLAPARSTASRGLNICSRPMPHRYPTHSHPSSRSRRLQGPHRAYGRAMVVA